MIPNVSNVLKGETKIERIYKGSDLVWEHIAIPKGYTLCKYLESTGTQFIDTHINADSRLGIWLKCYEVSGRFGAYVGNPELRHHTYSGSSLYGFNSKGYGNSYALPYEYELKVNYREEKTLYFNQYEYSIYKSLFDLHTNYGLFKRIGELEQYWRGKLYFAKMTYEDKLVRNFIPCLDENNRPCLYDTLTKQPFYNEGTGIFKYELESNAKQYDGIPCNVDNALYNQAVGYKSPFLTYVDNSGYFLTILDLGKANKKISFGYGGVNTPSTIMRVFESDPHNGEGAKDYWTIQYNDRGLTMNGRYCVFSVSKANAKYFHVIDSDGTYLLRGTEA